MKRKTKKIEKRKPGAARFRREFAPVFLPEFPMLDKMWWDEDMREAKEIFNRDFTRHFLDEDDYRSAAMDILYFVARAYLAGMEITSHMLYGKIKNPEESEAKRCRA